MHRSRIWSATVWMSVSGRVVVGLDWVMMSLHDRTGGVMEVRRIRIRGYSDMLRIGKMIQRRGCLYPWKVIAIPYTLSGSLMRVRIIDWGDWNRMRMSRVDNRCMRERLRLGR